jgi:PAS domain S-box-containing protein
MDIRTKLVFVLVAVALGSMFPLGWIMYTSAEVNFRESRLEQLDGLAEANAHGLEEIFGGWIDRVSLVSSRSQIPLTLREYVRTGSPGAVDDLRSTLSEVVRAVDVIDGLAIHDVEGRRVASAGTDIPASGLEEALFPYPVSEALSFEGVFTGRDDDLRVGFVARITAGNELIGHIHFRLDGSAVRDLVERDLGLGETGETLVVALNADGSPRVLHRSGISGAQLWQPTPSGGGTDPVLLALEGEEGVFSQNVLDDRGEPVWAAVRYFPPAGWGLVVKVDADEGRASLLEFRDQAFRLTLSLGAFAILFGTLLGLRFARPIHELAEAANRIRKGEFSARAPVSGEDEVSVLARNFNRMADEFEEQVTLLREYQRYFEVSRDMLCIAGPDGYFKRVNPAFRRTLGWNERQLLSAPFLDFVHPEDLKKTEEEIQRLAKGLPTISFENRYKTPQGGYRTLMWTAHPDEGTGLIYAIARDITEQKKAWEEIQEEVKELRTRLRELQAEVKGHPWSS